MPPLASTTYIRALAGGGAGASRLPLGECLAALAKVGIQTDYDLLLQSDVLEQTPAALHQHIRALRMAVVEHFASAGSTAADLLAAVGPGSAIQSGIRPLDSLLDGGVSPGGIVEMCAEDAPSRTRVAIEFATGHLVSSAAGPRVFMLQSSPLAVWLVERSLRKRLGPLPAAQREQLFARAMERLIVVDCGDLDALLGFLYYYVDTYASDMAGGRDPAAADLVVIDSIRPLVIGAMQQHEGSDVAVYAVRTALREITGAQRRPPAAVLVTNGVSRRGRSDDDSSAPPPGLGLAVQPSLGIAWAMVSHTHVHLHENAAPSAGAEDCCDYTAVVLKSPCTRVGSQCQFRL
ncbi:DNA repair protein rad51d [Coemansia helicoidea]|uniref:DNA repair protein rad51d n=1 Tax=Coemansia helicoidea TaxID=1286919 RepID=A0ACC1LA79_9FUNG|nr:DNA repair protein rad51d [Coemansia helicoidea]